LGFSAFGRHKKSVGKPSAKEEPIRMKSFMILGAIIGFLIGAGFSLAADCPWATVVWRAPVAALVVAVLARWWGRIWLEGLQGAIEQRHYAQSITPENSKPPTKK
jgi:hypothetical protein